MNTKVLRGCAGFVVALLAVGSTGCESPAADPGPGATGSPSRAVASGTPAGYGVAWRGARFTRPGWRFVEPGDTTACMLPKQTPDRLCDNTDEDVPRHVGNWLWMYAADITQPDPDPGRPADTDSFDREDMGFWPFRAGHVPAELRFDDEPDLVTKGTAPVGDRTAWYTKWRIHDEDVHYYIAQRWMLAKSRLCLISLSRDEQGATEVYKLVEAIDMTGYQPTKPGTR